MNETTDSEISSTPDIRGGKPRIDGTRITVSDIVIWAEQGQSPDEMVTEYPQLTLSGVHAALSYYYSHQAEIDEQIRNSEAFIDGLRKKDQRVEKTDVKKATDGDSVSS